MRINRNVFIYGFNIGYFLGYYDFGMDLSNQEIIAFAKDSAINVVNSFLPIKIDENTDYGEDFHKLISHSYIDVFYKENDLVDYVSLGKVFFALRTEKIVTSTQYVEAMSAIKENYLKGISWKLVLRKKKFLDFLEYLLKTSRDLNVNDIDVIASAVHLYLTNSFAKNEDCYYYLLDYAESEEEDDDGFNDKEELYINNDKAFEYANSELSEKYVFISYSSKNQKIADLMQEKLNSYNIRTWIATKDIPAGTDYPSVISDAIENSSCVLLILSNEAQQSRYVMSEIRLAYDSNIPIVCMNIDNCQLISGFRLLLGTQHIVSVGSHEDLDKIFSAIESYIK